MEKTIGLITGDGSSPEIVDAAVKVLDEIAKLYGHEFTYKPILMGGRAIDELGDPFPESEYEKCLETDSVLLGAVGGPKWDHLSGERRPEKGLLKLRSQLGLYSNIRPAKIWKELAEASPLKKEIVDQGIDFVIVRELTGGIYFGDHKRWSEKREKEIEKQESQEGQKESSEEMRFASDLMIYDEDEIRRIGKIAFDMARKRNKKVHLIDKANVLESSRLYREVIDELAKEYPDIDYNVMLVDNAAMQIVKDPSQFDVIVTENMFGDILSDEASEITGSIGMIPSSSLGEGTLGVYEPIHGSAPDLAGKDIVNPIACILSAAMMLRYSFDMDQEADVIEKAVENVLQKGYRTADIAKQEEEAIGTREMTRLILDEIKALS